MKVALVVDDSKIVRKVTRKILEALGYLILEAENGAIALEIYQARLPELIILDWHMPVMNGLEFLKKLRALPEGDKPVVIFCTTETELSNIQEAITCGANEYVMKPFDEEIIRGKLEQLGL
jgi:two-component system chemotaxis response regulator CheY